MSSSSSSADQPDWLYTNKDSKSILSHAEKEKLYNHVIWEGTKAAGLAALGATAAAAGLSRTWPLFNRLRLPFKTFLVLGVTTGTFFTVTDRASIRVSREVAKRHAINPQSHELEVRHIEPITGLRQYIIKHRYPIVMSIWSGTLAGAFLYNWRRRDITRGQKIINARLVAQVMALAGIGGIAAITASDPHDKQVEKSFPDRWDRYVEPKSTRPVISSAMLHQHDAPKTGATSTPPKSSS
ncbi:hypothetical protein DFS34DRAFT_594234 [Phlyctochytrium arcticum]|nr:hypothetical protein DFS34DRAFT_594234 [Phlyctochytrium arcticum]